MTTVWQKIPKPFFVQAPMEDVTDTVFRQIIKMAGEPDMYFTEFTNADGIVHGGSRYTAQRLQFLPKEKPLIAQIWGNNPDNYVTSCKLLVEMGYDGIDINMGCPVRKVVKRGNCSGLIRNPKLAGELIQAAKEGAGKLPVSVKTRIGNDKIVTEEWIGFLLEQKLDAITVHARTSNEMTKVPVHAEEFGKAVKLRDSINPDTLIIANGDIMTREQGLDIVSKYHVDGIMIARGLLHNPWVFNKNKKFEDISVHEKLELLKKHVVLFESTWGKTKNFELMKKFYKAYINGFDKASEMRTELVLLHGYNETIEKLNSLISEYK